MKKNILLLLLFSAVFITCCKDDDDGTEDPMDALPEATQTGAQTFGCLINGEPFVPPSFGNNRPNAFYQFVDGAYTLGISGTTGGGPTMRGLNFGCLDVVEIIEEGMTYSIKEFDVSNYFGEYFGATTTRVDADSSNPGTLIITRFDDSIISGTFEYQVIDDNGNVINITEGRFDLNYTN